jgi:adenylate cyclase
MRFRIGINLGDVMVEGDDLFGDGVNVAARLQALADPGGILISGPVFEQVRKKLALAFDFLGPQSVKNIAEPVPAWRVVLNGDATADDRAATAGVHSSTARIDSASAPAGAGAERARWRRLRRSIGVAAVLIAFFLALNMLTGSNVLWFKWPSLAILLLLGLRVAFVVGK